MTGEVPRMGLPSDNEPDLPNAWLFWLWLAASAFWFYICHDYTASQHYAYWRETTSAAAGLGLFFTVFPGFRRVSSWLAIVTMVPLIYLTGSHLGVFFWVAYYFTVIFSFGRSLTLRKATKITAVSGVLIGYGAAVDPIDRPLHLAQAMLAWMTLFAVMLLVNALYRWVRGSRKPAHATLPILE